MELLESGIDGETKVKLNSSEALALLNGQTVTTNRWAVKLDDGKLRASHRDKRKVFLTKLKAVLEELPK
jgi:hypothetical protein